MVILENVTKSYHTARGEVHALRDVNFHIEKGEFIILSGPSGSGKTTLLMTIAAMLRPSSGSISIEKRNLYQMSMRERANFRAENIGFVFQMFHLIPYLNIVENVLLARRPDSLREAQGQAARVCRQAGPTDRLKELLAQLGLEERALHKPAELSAGEKQRAAIARALFNRPKLILADEPTGNLDPDNATSVLGYLSEFHHAGGTVIVATHGQSAEQFADRIVYLRNGALK